MKISLNADSVIDGLYARSALHAFAADNPGSYISRMLTPAQAPALRRIIADAAICALSFLAPDGWRPGDTPLSFDAPDTLQLDDASAAAILALAVTDLTANIISAAAAPLMAAAARAAATERLQSLRTPAARPCFITPRT